MSQCHVPLWYFLLAVCHGCTVPSQPPAHSNSEPENLDLQGSKETPLHHVMMSGGLLINNGTVFPGTQSRERSVLAAAGPDWLVFQEDAGQRGVLSECVLPPVWAEAGYACLKQGSSIPPHPATTTSDRQPCT